MFSTQLFIATLVLLFPPFAIGQRAGYTRGGIFQGCVGFFPDSTIGNPGTVSSGFDCAIACQTTAAFAYFRNGICRCSGGYTQYTDAWVNGNSGGCTNPTVNAEMWTTATTFAPYGGYYCRAAASVGGTKQPVTGGAKSCFTACASYKFALWSPTTSNGFQCVCDNTGNVGQSAASVTCGRNTYFVYAHSPEAQFSQLNRRKLLDQKLALANAQKQHHYCPRGLTACNVPGTDGYECVDSQNDIESCGGCVYGAFGSESGNGTGTDCTRISSRMGSFTCESGICRAWKCPAGTSLRNGQCE